VSGGASGFGAAMEGTVFEAAAATAAKATSNSGSAIAAGVEALSRDGAILRLGP